MPPATNLQSQSYTSQVSQATSHVEGSLGYSPFFGGKRGGVATLDRVSSHVTMASTLQGRGNVAGGGVTSSELPQHTTDIGKLQNLLQELMMVYAIGGVSHLASHSSSV